MPDSLPSFPLARIFTLRDKLVQKLLRYADGTPREGAAFEALVLDAAQALPRGIDLHPLFNSLAHLAGRPLDRHELVETCWRLAGNLNSLRSGLPIPDWRSLSDPFFVPVEVLDHVRTLTRKRKPAALYTLRFLAGPACPLTTRKTWPVGLIRAVVAQEIGFTPPWGTLPFEDSAQLVQTRFLVLQDPHLTGEVPQAPAFEQFACTQYLRTFNRVLFKARRRIDAVCPRGYPLDEVPCHTCPFGYDECPAATHSRTYVPRFCPRCGCETLHDPARKNICLQCPTHLKGDEACP